MLRKKDPAIQRTIVIHSLLAAYALLGCVSITSEEIESHLDTIIGLLENEPAPLINWHIFSKDGTRRGEIGGILENAEMNVIVHVETINTKKHFVFYDGAYARARRRISSMLPYEETDNLIVTMTRALQKLPLGSLE